MKSNEIRYSHILTQVDLASGGRAEFARVKITTKRITIYKLLIIPMGLINIDNIDRVEVKYRSNLFPLLIGKNIVTIKLKKRTKLTPAGYFSFYFSTLTDAKQFKKEVEFVVKQAKKLLKQ